MEIPALFSRFLGFVVESVLPFVQLLKLLHSCLVAQPLLIVLGTSA